MKFKVELEIDVVDETALREYVDNLMPHQRSGRYRLGAPLCTIAMEPLMALSEPLLDFVIYDWDPDEVRVVEPREEDPTTQ